MSIAKISDYQIAKTTLQERSNQLGPTSATCLVIANMIGAGVFTTSGFALSDLGSPHQVIVAWLVGGVIAICGAISYGMLAEQIHESGGEYVFLSRLVHPLAGFLAGWVSLLAGFTAAIAFAATALEAYTWPGSQGLVGIAAIAACGLLHGVGLKVGATGQNAVVLLKLTLVIGFILLAGSRLPALPMQLDLDPQPFSIGAFAMSLVWISLSFSGFNAAVYIAEDVKDSERTVPRALWIGTLIVTSLYLALNAIFVYTPPTSAIAGREDVAMASAQVLGGMRLASALRAIIGLALLSSISSMIMAAPRVYARMAKDGVLPRQLAFNLQGSDSHVPSTAIGVQVVLACGLVLITELQTLLSYLGFTLSLSAAATVASIFVLHTRQRQRTSLKLFAPVIFVGATLVLAAIAAHRQPLQLAGTLATVVSGVLAYYAFRDREG